MDGVFQGVRETGDVILDVLESLSSTLGYDWPLSITVGEYADMQRKLDAQAKLIEALGDKLQTAAGHLSLVAERQSKPRERKVNHPCD